MIVRPATNDQARRLVFIKASTVDGWNCRWLKCEGHASV
jgi:hypothetical protein